MKILNTDVLEVVNGPEDGTEFALTRPNFKIGTDSSCVVNLRLDPRVEAANAHVTVVSQGYRVRSLGGAPITADGKRVGRIRSCILRSGGLLRVGSTEMLLQCPPGGLASRSRALPTENDAVWTLRLLFSQLGALSGVLWWLLALLRGRWLSFVVGIISALIALRLLPYWERFLPEGIANTLYWVRYWIFPH